MAHLHRTSSVSRSLFFNHTHRHNSKVLSLQRDSPQCLSMNSLRGPRPGRKTCSQRLHCSRSSSRGADSRQDTACSLLISPSTPTDSATVRSLTQKQDPVSDRSKLYNYRRSPSLGRWYGKCPDWNVKLTVWAAPLQIPFKFWTTSSKQKVFTTEPRGHGTVHVGEHQTYISQDCFHRFAGIYLKPS